MILTHQALSRNAWIYFASNDRSYATFYKGSSTASLPDEYRYDTAESQTGPGFEYLIGRYVILGICSEALSREKDHGRDR